MSDEDTPNGGEEQRSSLFARLRTYFIAGIVIIAPATITIWAALWFIRIFDDVIKPLIPTIYNPDHYLPFTVPGTGLVFALLIITLVGMFSVNLVGATLIGWWDSILHRTPVVRSIYKGSKQVFQTIFSEKGQSFRNVCLVEWPRKGIWAIAFVSREVDGGEVGLEPGRALYAVYIATTPNPTGGYLFFADKADVRILNMTIEDGLKLVISMGIVMPEKPLPPGMEAKAAAKPSHPA